MKNLKVRLLIAALAASVSASPVPAFAMTQTECESESEESTSDEAEETQEEVEETTSQETEEETVEEESVSAETTTEESELEVTSDDTSASTESEEKELQESKVVSEEADEEETEKTTTKKRMASSSTATVRTQSSTFDNSTSLLDGTYYASDFSVTGGTGKATFYCDKIVVENGKTYAYIRVSSKYYTKFKVNGTSYSTTVSDTGNYAKVPVTIGESFTLSGYTTAMSTPHWVDYDMTITLKCQYADGYYTADEFTYSGGTGKLTITCNQIKVAAGEVTGIITFSSGKISKLVVGSTTYQPTNQTSSATSFEIPLTLNADNTIVATTTAMSTPHDVTYTIHPTLLTSTKRDANIDDQSAQYTYNNTTTEESEEEEAITTPTKKKKLKVGCTYKIKAATDNRMFYIAPKKAKTKHVILKVKKNGKYQITMSLTGTGYDYLYVGTAKKAAKVKKKKLSKYKKVNGYYTYTFTVDTLDEALTISAHSKKYDKWYEHKIIFYSAGAKKTSKSNLASTLETKTEDDSSSSASTTSTDASSVSTSAVDSSTTLADGTYQPDGFSWSGGSGRLSYIKCTKITVKNGKAYATIVFGSTKYDKLRASGQVYARQGGGNSTFTIPVTLNANNTIVGRTTAMSSPHWIQYSIYISLAAAGGGETTTAQEADTEELSEEAPEILGLTGGVAEEIEYAKNFKIFDYDDGIKLVQIDVTAETGFYEEDEKKQEEDEVEYDDDGQVVAKSQTEITTQLYQNNVINYLLVPEDVEIPAGLEKEYIIITVPSESTFASSENAYAMLEQLGVEKNVTSVGLDTDAEYTDEDIIEAIADESMIDIGSLDDPDYRSLIEIKTDLAILPSSLLPEEVDEDATKEEQEEQKSAIKDAKEKYETLTSRFATLDVPVFVDRADLEEEDLAKAEWIKVYGAIYGCADEAEEIFEEEVDDYEENEQN
ncbi:MAG: hypothetical protein K6G01_06255 [Eubacterium sp.]|nr:hypothetical protein [Eubacterium sp.]